MDIQQLLNHVAVCEHALKHTTQLRGEERRGGSGCLASSRYTESSFPPPLVAPVSGARLGLADYLIIIIFGIFTYCMLASVFF